MTDGKASALQYFQSLKKALRSSGMPKSESMNAVIRSTVTAAKTNDKQKNLRLPEAAFLNRFAIPVLFQHLQTEMGLSEVQARESFLNEYHRTMPETSNGSPIFPLRYPFRKALGATADSIYQEWHEPKKGDGLTQSAPDFALRQPFPHSIVFEGKYFASGSQEYGGRQLATDLYQAFFYRALPRTPAKKKGGADWIYDYACLLAFDASKNGTLLGAWKALSLKVRKSFWESGNIYVMILRD
jgi:hypothetical protein